MKPVKRVVIAGNGNQEKYVPELEDLLRRLASCGIETVLEQSFAQALVHSGVAKIWDAETAMPDSETGAVLSIGGDGTFLRTARWVGALGTPLLGINTGHLGFLAAYTPDETAHLVSMLHQGTGIVEERMALQVIPDAYNGNEPLYALNEVAILKDETASMINTSVTVDGACLADYMGDGLIVSTPMGSTGYNLSVGGPILQPGLKCVSIVPIAPHSLTIRPFVADAASTLRAVTTGRARRYRVSLDGISFLMETGSGITIRKAPFAARIIRRPTDSFATPLRAKLHWGMR